MLIEQLLFGAGNRLAEHLAEAHPVAERAQLGSQRGAMRAVLRASHVAHVGPPAARVAASLQALASPPPDRGRVLVTVEATPGRIVLEQPVATLVRRPGG